MARRTARLGRSKSKPKMEPSFPQKSLDYHEGLSINQVKIVLREFSLEYKYSEFSKWMYGQTCPVISRFNQKNGQFEETGGIYEYDLFRWIAAQKGATLIWD